MAPRRAYRQPAASRTATNCRRRGESPALAPLFGFVQLDFAGQLSLADGRYLVQAPAGEGVLVVQTTGAPAPPLRRRRRPRPAELEAEPQRLPLTRVTAIRAFAPFSSEAEAGRWLEGTVAGEEEIDAVLEAGIELLNRALYAQAIGSADPNPVALRPERAAATRIGFGDGEELAESFFAAAHEVDARAGGSRRRRRDEELRPQQRVAALLRGREPVEPCEPLLLRARADLDAGRPREAALQLRVGLEALLAELHDALDDEDHHRDVNLLRERRAEAGEAANRALAQELGETEAASVGELLEVCERILRRRRILAE